mgnify:CR=1 FL=1
MQQNRLVDGGRIDRSKPLNFSFNGKRYQGYAGDTLASALLANGVSVVGRSFKLHRPRGIVGHGAEEPNALLQIGTGASTLPNQRATQVELYEGLEARSSKGWPNVNFDLGAVNDVFSRLLSAGFYYKTFMYPRALRDFYEKLIRRAAGIGKSPTEADPDYYDHRNAHCDVLIVGAGPAGLMAALVAAQSGARVIIADDQNEFGGSLLATNEVINGQPAAEWLRETIATLGGIEDAVMLPRSTVFGYYEQNFLTLTERCTDHLGKQRHDQPRERHWRVRAKQVVLAQGAFERPLVFCNNDRPGIMLASAVSGYVNRYAVCPGRQAVVFTNNDSAYQAAIDLRRAGVTVAAIVDSRAEGAGVLGVKAQDIGIPVMRGHIVTDVSWRGRLTSVDIAQWNGDIAATIENTITIRCDLLAISGGWSPAVHLHSQSGGKNVWDDRLHCFVPGEPVQACVSAGAGAGVWSLRDCLKSGLDAGRAVVKRCGLMAADIDLPKAASTVGNDPEPLWRVPSMKNPDRCPKQFLDFQTDVCVADVRLAAREGYTSIEHLKRYTALGFGTDQGKLGNINGMAVLAECLNEPIQSVGTTTFRPAYTPVTFGACAGEGVGALFDPQRKTAIHEWHEGQGAPFENVGQWLRPWYFPRGDEDLDAAVARECLATRNSVGMMDASTLGKIDVQGADSVTFLERIYTHDVGKMEVGRCAYGIMLGEDGMVKDDGVMARVGAQRFYLTTTTGGAATVLAWLEIWLQTEWPELDVRLTSLTEHFSTIAVVGPNSRRVLQKLDCSIGLEREVFSFMEVKDARLAGLPVQIFRVSFSGELAFEVNINSNYALHMWRALMEAGSEFDITPYGTEAMHVLRAEKGFVIVGQDTDGSVNPIDLGMTWMLSVDKDYLGKRSLSRPDAERDGRKQLVGLRSVDATTVLGEGAQLIDQRRAEKPVPMCGHVTSSYASACLGHPIALAMVVNGRARKGDRIFAAASDGSTVPVEIGSAVFYDPKGERQNV